MMEFAGITFNSASEIVSGVVVAIIALALGVRKLHAMFAADGVSIAKVNSELDIITLLREQIKELSNANKELRAEIDSLRQFNQTLANENDDVKLELRRLQNQIKALSNRCPTCPARDESWITGKPASPLVDQSKL